MGKGKYILINGSFILSDEYKATLEELFALRFSEKFRTVKSSFPFFDETFELLKLKFLLLNQPFSDFSADGGTDLKRQMERTLTKNKHFGGAIVTLTFSFSGGKTAWMIQTETTEHPGFVLNEKGLFIELFDKIQKSVSSLSSISLGSEPYWEIASCHREASSADDVIIVNTEDSILEVPGANLYLIKANQIFGPSEESGVYIDITKPLMLNIFESLGFSYSEPEEITIDLIRSADEVFTANAIDGIRWVVGFQGKRFFNNAIRKISEQFSLLSVS